jgi:pseudoazurin
MIRLFTLLFVMITMTANAADVTIDMLNKDASGRKMVYSKEIAEVAVGDTITWLPASKGHNVHFISAPDGVKKLPKSKFNKEFSYTFEKEGIYLYQCTPHKGMGMIALVVVGDNLDNLANIKKAKVLGKSKKKLKELLSQL